MTSHTQFESRREEAAAQTQRDTTDTGCQAEVQVSDFDAQVLPEASTQAVQETVDMQTQEVAGKFKNLDVFPDENIKSDNINSNLLFFCNIRVRLVRIFCKRLVCIMQSSWKVT